MYGSDRQLANELRTFVGGKLRYDTIGNEEYCPQNPNKFVFTGIRTEEVAFLAGNLLYNFKISCLQILDILVDERPYAISKV